MKYQEISFDQSDLSIQVAQVDLSIHCYGWDKYYFFDEVLLAYHDL